MDGKKHFKKLFLLSFMTACLIYLMIVNQSSYRISIPKAAFEDECEYVYLDVGTNVGIEIRKLFEPHLYNNSDVISVFDEFFGEYE